MLIGRDKNSFYFWGESGGVGWDVRTSTGHKSLLVIKPPLLFFKWCLFRLEIHTSLVEFGFFDSLIYSRDSPSELSV